MKTVLSVDVAKDKSMLILMNSVGEILYWYKRNKSQFRRLWLSKNDLYANLKAMTRQYFYLLQQNVSCKNRYKRLLNIWFLELEKIFKSTRIYDDTALNFSTCGNSKRKANWCII